MVSGMGFGEGGTDRAPVSLKKVWLDSGKRYAIMPPRGKTVRVPKGKVIEAVHKNLKAWEKPTREGMDLFAQHNVALKYDLDPNLSIVESRIAVNRMLLTYI